MTKKKAKKLLENWMERKIKLYGRLDLPIKDEVVYTNFGKQYSITQYTFKGLIKIAYDL